ncbi:MAG: acyl-CoA synthetase [Actinomycetia bacterium]|nr:acyl-CoA synthetase [Actinomycetes bacterium]MCP4958778.1 acyl-CoA synthetase [Actinomycetes bacterium]
MALTYPDVWEAIADTIPDEPAVIQGDRTVAWGEFDERSARLAAAFDEAGIGLDSKVGMFLYNCPEYLETQFAAFKVRATPFNVNYRYLDDELWYLLDNAECEALVFHSSLGDRIGRIRERLPRLKLLVELPDSDDHLDGARLYEEVIAAYAPADRIARREDDIYMLYTGGTTGMPKGVMYGMGSFTQFFLNAIAEQGGLPPFESSEQVAAIVGMMKQGGLLGRGMPCCPLMHGTGVWLGAMVTHLVGGAVVLMESRHLDVDEVWSVIERHGVTSAVIVGDAFARPMLRALNDRAETGSAYDTSSLERIVSSGAMFSTEVKQGLLGHMPHVAIQDVLGSTEGGMGQNVAVADADTADTAKFELTPGVKVFDEDDNEIVPGSGDLGMVASTSANVPLGYYKDEEKTARTFREIGGVRYTFHGDMATVEDDGSITLLGRGSNSINTGGEKVFPEEVEEAVKTHPAVHDCLVFGVPDERFGERVVGVASLEPDGDIDAEGLIEHTKQRLSHFKAPRQLVFVETVPRAPNGKADYSTARDMMDVG